MITDNKIECLWVFRKEKNVFNLLLFISICIEYDDGIYLDLEFWFGLCGCYWFWCILGLFCGFYLVGGCVVVLWCVPSVRFQNFLYILRYVLVLGSYAVAFVEQEVCLCVEGLGFGAFGESCIGYVPPVWCAAFAFVFAYVYLLDMFMCIPLVLRCIDATQCPPRIDP